MFAVIYCKMIEVFAAFLVQEQIEEIGGMIHAKSYTQRSALLFIYTN